MVRENRSVVVMTCQRSCVDYSSFSLCFARDHCLHYESCSRLPYLTSSTSTPRTDSQEARDAQHDTAAAQSSFAADLPLPSVRRGMISPFVPLPLSYNP